jgi:uncharacterized membrane protein YphA (DoxX/SURF4 family)
MQQIMFMKNLALMGGALLVIYFGAGPLSVDDWLQSRSQPAEAKAPAESGAAQHA